MNDLDDLKKIGELDPAGMLKAEEDFYDQLIEARTIAENTDLSKISSKEFTAYRLSGVVRSFITRTDRLLKIWTNCPG